MSLQASWQGQGEGPAAKTQYVLTQGASFFLQGLRSIFTSPGEGAHTSECPRLYSPEMASLSTLRASISILSPSFPHSPSPSLLFF